MSSKHRSSSEGARKPSPAQSDSKSDPKAPAPSSPMASPTKKRAEKAAAQTEEDLAILRALAAHRESAGSLPAGLSAVAAALGDVLPGFSDSQIYTRVRTIKKRYKRQLEKSKAGGPVPFSSKESEDIFKLCEDLWGSLDGEKGGNGGSGRAKKVLKKENQSDVHTGDRHEEESDFEEASEEAVDYRIEPHTAMEDEKEAEEASDEDVVPALPNSMRFRFARASYEEIAKGDPDLSVDLLLRGFDMVDVQTAREADETFRALHIDNLQLQMREADMVKKVMKKLQDALAARGMSPP